MKKGWKLWILMSLVGVGSLPFPIQAQETGFMLGSLPNVEDLDALSEEELKTLYEKLLKAYAYYQSLPESQKAQYTQFFNRLEDLLTWFTSQIMPLEDHATVFRLYNFLSGEHLFTESLEEIQTLLKTGWWQMEGKGWIAPSASDRPVYRVLDPIALEHFYTMDAQEYASLQERGFQGEGIGFYSAASDQTPLYRLFNPNALFGAHHYTSDLQEREVLLSQGWKDEGIAWYGLTGPSAFEEPMQDMLEEKD